VLLPEGLASEFGLANGDAIELAVEGRLVTARIVGTVREAALDPGGSNLPIVADIATAQELLSTDEISRIDLVLTVEEERSLAQRLQSIPGFGPIVAGRLSFPPRVFQKSSSSKCPSSRQSGHHSLTNRVVT